MRDALSPLMRAASLLKVVLYLWIKEQVCAVNPVNNLLFREERRNAVLMHGEKNDWGGVQVPKHRGKLRMIY